MKKALLLLVLLVIVALVVLFVLGGRSGIPALDSLRYLLSPEVGELTRLTESFLEDLQYKDFASAASYHTWADQDKVDIARLIERMFAVKPEQLNIRDLRVTEVDLDSKGRRARTFFTAHIELLNSATTFQQEENEQRRVEGVLYWHKRRASEGGPPGQGAEDRPSGDAWFMMLESSLR